MDERRGDIEKGVKLSGHLLSEEIGQGGFSRVFKAVPEAGGPAVAIKVAIRPELVEALRAEGSVLRRLSGPRFVQIIEEHLDSEPPFVVLELCEGGDLRAHLDTQPEKRLRPGRVEELARGILEGVAFAHEEGVVHGDLKPENVLLDGEGEPKIADLGLSRARRRELLVRRNELQASASVGTEPSKVRGTFDYLAPEVRGGGEITPASDVYALGVLFYELLVGQRPYGLFKLPGEILAPKAGLSADEDEFLSPALDRVVARALAHEARDRYPDAGVMLADLLAGEAGLELAPVERSRVEGPNPLLAGLAQESFLDTAIIVGWVAFYCALLPVIILLVCGLFLPAAIVAGTAAGLSAVVLGAAWVAYRARSALLVRRTTAALEEAR